MQQPVGQTWNGGAPILNGGAGTTGPPAGDGPGWKQCFKEISSCVSARVTAKPNIKLSLTCDSKLAMALCTVAGGYVVWQFERIKSIL